MKLTRKFHRLVSLSTAELLHQRLVIKGSPDFPDFALNDLEVVDAWQAKEAARFP